MNSESLPKLLLSRRDVCAMTGFGLTKVTRLQMRGVIPSTMVEGQRLTKRADLEEFVNSLKPDMPRTQDLASHDTTERAA